MHFELFCKLNDEKKKTLPATSPRGISVKPRTHPLDTASFLPEWSDSQFSHEYTYIYTGLEEKKNQEIKCQQFRVHSPEILPFLQSSNRSFPECQEFQWCILGTMTPAHRHWATNNREASKSGQTDPQGYTSGLHQNNQKGLRESGKGPES